MSPKDFECTFDWKRVDRASATRHCPCPEEGIVGRLLGSLDDGEKKRGHCRIGQKFNTDGLVIRGWCRPDCGEGDHVVPAAIRPGRTGACQTEHRPGRQSLQIAGVYRSVGCDNEDDRPIGVIVSFVAGLRINYIFQVIAAQLSTNRRAVDC